MIAAGTPLGADSHMYLGPTLLGGMNTGFPRLRGNNVQWQTRYSHAGAALSTTGLSLLLRADNSASSAVYLSIPVADLDPVLPGSLSAGAVLIVTWALGLVYNLGTLSSVIPGSGHYEDNTPPSLVVSAQSSGNQIIQRLAGLGSWDGAASARIQFFVPNPNDNQPPIGDEGMAGALDAAEAVQAGAALEVTGASEGAASVRYAFSYPAIEDASIFQVPRFLVLYSPGPVLLYAHEILTPAARVLSAERDGAYVDLVLANAV